MSECLRLAPEDKENHAFFPFFLAGRDREPFGSLEGTGTAVLGRQGSRTDERVPGTGA